MKKILQLNIEEESQMSEFHYGPRKVSVDIAAATSTNELRSVIANSIGLPVGTSFVPSGKILRAIDLSRNGVSSFHDVPKTSGLNSKLLDLLMEECTTRSEFDVIIKQIHAASSKKFYSEDESKHIHLLWLQKMRTSSSLYAS